MSARRALPQGKAASESRGAGSGARSSRFAIAIARIPKPVSTMAGSSFIIGAYLSLLIIQEFHTNGDPQDCNSLKASVFQPDDAHSRL
ncbi:MAG: hypothetical protein HKO57_13435 [Akkermansiaceae bacterium]|nr:hypothetical protein [Akkermansiaceae bacterium]